MRRTLLAVTAGFAIALTTAACSTTDTPSASDSKPPVAATSAAASANTKEVCAELEAKLQPMMTTVGAAIGELVGYKQAGATAQVKAAEEKAKAEITKAAADVEAIGAKATDATVKADFGKVAANMKASLDLKFLTGVTGVENMTEPLTKELTGWIEPLSSACKN